MADDSRFVRIEEILDKIHSTVKKIETTHGVKIDAVAEGSNATSRRLDGIEKRLEQVDSRLNRVETNLSGMKTHLDHIEGRLNQIDKGFGSVQQTNTLLQTIANDHENRLLRVESSVRGNN